MSFKIIKSFIYSGTGERHQTGDFFSPKNPKEEKDAQTLINMGFLEANKKAPAATKATTRSSAKRKPVAKK